MHARKTQDDGCEKERNREKERERGRYPDEANSKRDVLLIILTAGVRLNERRSQTHGARCKFNYREEEERVECERNDNERTKLILLPASLCFRLCARETERERLDEVTGNPSIYMTAVCLGRLLMGEREEGRL